MAMLELEKLILNGGSVALLSLFVLRLVVEELFKLIDVFTGKRRRR